MLFSLLAVAATAATAMAKTVSYDFNVTWVTANPDGLMERKVMGINNEWPLPLIEVDIGDRLLVNVYNGLGDKSTSIHWHGMFQNGSNEMDGATMVTQCPIAPGASFTYDFVVNQTGTYWYHCHTDLCYPDGYRQALIVHDAAAPYEGQYEEEFVLTLSDWYHDLMEDLEPGFMSRFNPTGAEPVPDSFLMNDTQNSTFAVKPNTTYLLHIINTGNFVAQYFYIEGHNMTIVEVDGVYTEPQSADILYVHIAQRVTVLVTTAASTDTNWKIVTVVDSDLLDTIPANIQLNNTNWLLLNESAPLDSASPEVMATYEASADIVAFDDFTLVPADGMALLPEPDITVNVTVYMVNLDTGANYAELNDITYTQPKVPSLFTALSAPSDELRANETIYGDYTHPVVLGHNQVVEIILNNADGGSHPFHLHGHNFQVIQREPPLGPLFNSYLDGDPIPYDADNHTDFPAVPIRRDVIALPPQGFVVLRFVADNPGVWLFHCHIDWHMQSGLAMIFVEAPDQIPSTTGIPDDHYAACAAAAVPSAGNAAANTADFLDLDGQNRQPGDIPDGWTPRGETAMAFSVLSAVLGVVALVVYGMADLKHHKTAAAAAAAAVVDSSSEGK